MNYHSIDSSKCETHHDMMIDTTFQIPSQGELGEGQVHLKFPVSFNVIEYSSLCFQLKDGMKARPMTCVHTKLISVICMVVYCSNFWV